MKSVLTSRCHCGGLPRQVNPFCLRNGGTQGEDNCVDNLAATARWSKTEEPEKRRFEPIIFIYYLNLLFTAFIKSSPPDISAYLETFFFISHPKHMLWVLKRTVSMRRFF